MFKTAKLAAVALFALYAGCATEPVDDGELLAPACEDAKCDGNGQAGFEVFKGSDGAWYFHVMSGNGRIVLRSQAYTSKLGAQRGVESVRTNGVDADNFKLKTASSGEIYFNLYAQNHQVIATSETYTRKYNAQRALASTVEIISEQQNIRAAQEGGARFQAFIGQDHQAYFHLRARNGEVMLVSEGYANASNAVRATTSVRENGKLAERYEIVLAADGQYFFRLEAANGETIARGETYSSRSKAQRAVDTLVALFESELVADPQTPAAPARSVDDQPDLKLALTALGEVAQGGEQLVYFGWAEQAQRPSTGVDCDDATAAEAVALYQGLVAGVQQSGNADARPDLDATLIAQSSTQLALLLGSDSYEVCTRQTGGETYVSAETFILSTETNGPRLVVELGYEP